MPPGRGTRLMGSLASVLGPQSITWFYHKMLAFVQNSHWYFWSWRTQGNKLILFENTTQLAQVIDSSCCSIYTVYYCCSRVITAILFFSDRFSYGGWCGGGGGLELPVSLNKIMFFMLILFFEKISKLSEKKTWTC